MRRHKWQGTQSQVGFSTVEQCAHCGTERVRDTSTKSLFLYRGGRATHHGIPVPVGWRSYIAGVIPVCVVRE